MVGHVEGRYQTFTNTHEAEGAATVQRSFDNPQTTEQDRPMAEQMGTCYASCNQVQAQAD